MDEAALEQVVVERIGKGIHTDDVILQVCHLTGWAWPEAESFVELVQINETDQIRRANFGLKLVLAGGVVLSGFGLIAIAGSILIFPTIGMDVPLASEPVAMVREAGLSATVLYVLLSTGISMVVGGILGLMGLYSHEK